MCTTCIENMTHTYISLVFTPNISIIVMYLDAHTCGQCTVRYINFMYMYRSTFACTCMLIIASLLYCNINDHLHLHVHVHVYMHTCIHTNGIQELEIEESMPTLSMRVDIATSGSSQLHDASKTDSQRSSYLHQNVAESDERGREIVDPATSLHHQSNAESTSIAGRAPSELRIVRPEEVQETYFHRNHQKETITSVEPLSFSEHSSSGGGGGFIVPTPQLHLSDIWESGKSVPTASHSSSKRTHSCHHIEFQRQVSKVEPHMPPSSSPTHHQAPPTSTNPALSASISTLSLKSSLGHMTPSHSAEPAGMAYQPVMYNAWTIATPSAPSTKHTASSRLMTKYDIALHECMFLTII